MYAWRRWFLIFAALALPGMASVVTLLPGKPQTPAEVAFQKGVDLLNGGQADKAAAAFRESLRLDPKQGISYVGLADVAFKKKNWKEAEEQFHKAVQNDPKNPGIQEAWGRFLFEMGRYQEAVAPLRAAAQGEAKNAGVRIALGDALMRGPKQANQAVEAYRDGLRLDPEHSGGLFGLGLALQALGRWDEASKTLELSAQLAPNNALPEQALGELLLARNETAGAMAAFDAAVKRNPNFALAHLSRGDIYFGRKNYTSAVTEYNQARTLNPKLAAAHMKAAMCYQVQGRPAEAKPAYLEVVKLRPGMAQAYNNLAWMAAEAGSDLDNALAWARKATRLAPDNAEFLDTLGWVYYQRGAAAQAMEPLRAATRKQPSASSFYHLGCAAQKLGQTAEARAAFQRALELDRALPQADDARRRLAQLAR